MELGYGYYNCIWRTNYSRSIQSTLANNIVVVLDFVQWVFKSIKTYYRPKTALEKTDIDVNMSQFENYTLKNQVQNKSLIKNMISVSYLCEKIHVTYLNYYSESQNANCYRLKNCHKESSTGLKHSSCSLWNSSWFITI